MSYQIGTNQIQIYASNDLQDWTHIASLNQGNIYTYAIEQGNWQYRYIKLININNNSSLTEIGFRNEDHTGFLPISILRDKQKDGPYPGSLLIDEQDKLRNIPYLL